MLCSGDDKVIKKPSVYSQGVFSKYLFGGICKMGYLER
jgi:hypothetical protein